MDDFGDYEYRIAIVNSTSDSLILIHGSEDTIMIDGMRFFSLDTIYILPLSEFDTGGSGINEGENPKHEVLNDRTRSFLSQTRIYRGDSLVANWKGPFGNMPDSVHHFYNYNSWETWLEDDGFHGVVQFTIYESDLIGEK